MTFTHVLLDVDDLVATVTLDDPERMNAMSVELIGGLMGALDEIGRRRTDIRCVIVTGAGRAFSAGGNLQGRRDENNQVRPGAGQTLDTVYHPLLRGIRNLHCPLVTSVNGAAAGAGMSLALMGDLVLAARSAFFLQAFRRIGLVPDCGSTWLLPRLIGRARASEMSLLGERVSAERAAEWGLINRVVDDADLVAETRTLATELARGPTATLSMIRTLYWESPDNTYEEQLALEERMQRRAGETDDYREGVAAFLDKRPAAFHGR